MRFRTRVGRVLIAMLAVATAVPLLATQAQAQAVPRTIDEAIVPLTEDPAGPLLFKLDYWINRPKDNLIAMVGGAAKATGITQTGNYYAKYRWMTDFDSTSDSLVWTVELAKATKFNVRFSMSGGAGDQFYLDVPGTSNNLRFEPSILNTVDLMEPGTITIPAGRHELRLRKSRSSGYNSLFKSIELVRASDYAAYQQRVKDFRVDMSWLRGKRGYMVQWGAWSYPRWGDKGTNQDVWNEFDVNKFVNEMVKAKVDYVMWSVTWIGYQFPGPIRAIDTIMGPGGDDRTADRDLLMEIGRGLRDKGIDMVVYYHTGHGQQYSGSWWDQQKYPGDTFQKNAYGDRSTFFNNWKSVIREVGQRYRWLIKGFFFDDGLTYYPADFEELGAVARTGYPDRFISYNPFSMARYTDFQDVNFGERNCVGQTDINGRYLDGPHEGLFQHCMFSVARNWGSYTKDWVNPGSVRTPELFHEAFGRDSDQGATSINNMMFNGPTFIEEYPDGTKGDINANMGLSMDIADRYVTNIEVGADGALFGGSESYTSPAYIFTPDANGDWQRHSAEGQEFSLNRFNHMYSLNDGDLIRNSTVNLGNDGYTITTISVGTDGSVYGLTDKGELIRWTLGRWRTINTGMTGLTDVSVGKDYKNVWLLDAKGTPMHYNGSRVNDYSGTTRLKFKQVEAAANGDLFAIATDGSLYEWRNRAWTKRTEANRVSDVAALSHSDFWYIAADTGWVAHIDGSDTVETVRSIIRCSNCVSN